MPIIEPALYEVLKGVLMENIEPHNCCELCNDWTLPRSNLCKFHTDLAIGRMKLEQLFLKTQNPQTQKAQGIRLSLKTNLGFQGLQTLVVYLFQSIEEIELNRSYLTYMLEKHKYFARPCPVKACHGFVDSRIVDTVDELIAVYQEALAEDPGSELLLSKFIEAKYNAVGTSSVVNIGLGHDGATTGKKSISLPVCGTLLNEPLKRMAGITDNVFVEAIYKSDTPGYVTQLRNGPELPREKNYIPKTFTVEHVYNAADYPQLLDWMRFTESMRGRNNVVVYHAEAGLGSHYGVHCILNKIPFVTTFVPIIGQTLEKIEQTPVNYELVRHGLELGLSDEFNQLIQELLVYGSDLCSSCYRMLMAGILYALRALPYMQEDNNVLLGVAMASMLRLTITAVLGEARHHTGVQAIQGHVPRATIYHKYVLLPIEGIKKLKIAEQLFLDGSWSDSFGGKKWAKCTRLTIKFVNSAIAFSGKASEKNYNTLVSNFNVLVDLVHNNGKFLNKFCPEDYFSLSADNLALFALAYAPDLYQFVEMTKITSSKRNTSLAGMKQIRKLSTKDHRLLEQINEATACLKDQDDDEGEGD
jgi:hypothetical protein